MKKLFRILIFMICLSSNAQDLRIMATQDLRLAISDDKTGNYKPFTMDLYAKFKMTGKRFDYGYLVISPAFEYVELEGVYKRYAVDLGYTFTNVLNDPKIEITPSINYGIQDRWSKAFLVFGADMQLTYWISNRIGLVGLLQMVERKDLAWRYDDYKIGTSGFLGLEIIFN